MSKPNLLLISDLLGDINSSYLLLYKSLLKEKFNVTILDACQLGEVTNTKESDKNHDIFINKGGLIKAVENLVSSKIKADLILGFSIGGTIAWKACLQKLEVNKLICISATRLRYETHYPNCEIELYFSFNDKYRPNSNWTLSKIINTTLISNSGHSIYKDETFIKRICDKVNRGK